MKYNILSGINIPFIIYFIQLHIIPYLCCPNPHYSTEVAKFALFPSLSEHTHV